MVHMQFQILRKNFYLQDWRGIAPDHHIVCGATDLLQSMVGCDWQDILDTSNRHQYRKARCRERS